MTCKHIEVADLVRYRAPIRPSHPSKPVAVGQAPPTKRGAAAPLVVQKLHLSGAIVTHLTKPLSNFNGYAYYLLVQCVLKEVSKNLDPSPVPKRLFGSRRSMVEAVTNPATTWDAMHTSSLPSSPMPRFNQVFVSELTVAKRESDKQLIVAQCVVADGRCPTLTPPPHRVRRNFVADRLPSWSRSPKRSTKLQGAPGLEAPRVQGRKDLISGLPVRNLESRGAEASARPSWPTSHHHRQKWFAKSSTHVVTRMFLRGFQSRHEIATYKPPLRPSISVRKGTSSTTHRRSVVSQSSLPFLVSVIVPLQLTMD